MTPAFIRQAEADQVEHLMQITLVVAPGATLGAFFVWMNFAEGPAAAAIHGWFAAFFLIACARIAASLHFRRRRPPSGHYQAWLIWACLSSLAHAACWVVFALLVPQPGNAAAETILHVVVAATAMGATMHLASFYALLVAYVVFTLAPLILRDLYIGGAEHLTLAALGVAIAIYSLISSGGHARALAQMLAQRRENASLILALKHENKAAVEAREIAEQANASKARLFAAANHDLRQPLHAASLLAMSLAQARSLEEVAPVAQRIGTCIDSLGDLVDAMLELSQLDSGAVTPQIRPFDLDDLIDEIFNANEPQASAKGLELRSDASRLWVRSDRKMVLRVLSNLVNNAVRYTRSGAVRVRLVTDDQRVRVSVLDTGPGIAQEELPRVFEEFYQVGNSARDRKQGLGLGLATSRRISDRLGLDLAVQSTVGQGSEFSFSLPVVEQPSADAPMARAHCPDGNVPARRVLVVEDDDESRDALELALLRFCATLEVEAARDAEHALRCLEKGFEPDLIVTDLRLGTRMDGTELIQAIRLALGRPVPAILVSGDVETNGVQRGEHGDTVVLKKPIKGVQLRSILEGAFQSTTRPPPTDHDTPSIAP